MFNVSARCVHESFTCTVWAMFTSQRKKQNKNLLILQNAKWSIHRAKYHHCSELIVSKPQPWRPRVKGISSQSTDSRSCSSHVDSCVSVWVPCGDLVSILLNKLFTEAAFFFLETSRFVFVGIHFREPLFCLYILPIIESFAGNVFFYLYVRTMAKDTSFTVDLNNLEAV